MSNITPFQKSFSELLKGKKNALENFLGNNENAMKFLSSAMHCLQTTPELEKCSQESLMGAFMEAASLGLFPGSVSGDCYILPYKGKAQFQMGYRGFKTLAFRCGIRKIGSEVVYENDKFEELLGTEQRLIHKRAEGKRGEAKGAYAWCEITEGNTVFRYMDKEQVMKIKELSQAKNSTFSPWNNGDPELWMWQKTAIKQLAKLLPTSYELDKAIHVDNISERGGYIDGEGEYVDVLDKKELPIETKEKIEKANSKKELKKVYEENKGMGKEFDTAVAQKKEELDKGEVAQDPKEEVGEKEVKQEAPKKTLEDDISETICKSILGSANLSELKSRYSHFEKSIANFSDVNKEKISKALLDREIQLQEANQ